MGVYKNLLKKDQNLRKKLKKNQISIKKFSKENTLLSEIFLKLIKQKGFPFKNNLNDEEYKAAIVLTLHLPNKYLKDVYKSLKKSPEKIDLSDEAYIVDKILVQNNKKQLYATQYRKTRAGKIVFFPIKNPNHIEKRRKLVGLSTLKEYRKIIKNNG